MNNLYAPAARTLQSAEPLLAALTPIAGPITITKDDRRVETLAAGVVGTDVLVVVEVLEEFYPSGPNGGIAPVIDINAGALVLNGVPVGFVGALRFGGGVDTVLTTTPAAGDGTGSCRLTLFRYPAVRYFS